jgi:hypothetical protein
MKQWLPAVMLLALMGIVLLTGCKQEDSTPEAPSTNAPAQP